MKRCSASNQDGRPCRAYALVDSSFCFWHDPASSTVRDAARRLGGDHRAPSADPGALSGVDLKSSEGLRSMAELLIQQTCGLPNSIQRSRALGYLMLAQRRLIEFDELAQRVQALEEVLKVKKVIDVP